MEQEGERVTKFLYKLEYDVTIEAPTKEDADEIANNISLGMDADVWSSMVQYRGVDDGD